MPNIKQSQIHNIALVDHEGAGETTLIEALLAEAHLINRMGHIKDHNTVSDFEPDEKEAEKSLYCSTISFPYSDLHFNFLDVPGTPDLIGEALTALHCVECAMVCVDAKSGVKANTRKMWRVAAQQGVPRIIAMTCLDAENTNFWTTLENIRGDFGKHCIPLYVPDAAASSLSKVQSVLHPPEDATPEEQARYEEILEAIVETDDDLMERYLEGETITEAELFDTLKQAVASGSLYPVVATSAEAGVGVKELLELLMQLAPPSNAVNRSAWRGDEKVPLGDVNDLLGYVYFTVADEFVARISYVRILSGELNINSEVLNRRSGAVEKVGHLYKVLGKQHEEITSASAGDIVAIPRISDMHAGDVITSVGSEYSLPDTKFPSPMVSVAVRPKTRKDEQRISAALHELENDDRTFHVHSDSQTGELVVSGMSDAHLELMLKRLNRKYKVDVDVSPPKIPYMETITASIENVEYTHKKQSGGAGQYGKVVINIDPIKRGDGYEFVDKIFGGVIDATYRPSVDKGVQARMKEGILAGYPVTDVRVTLIDGKTHPVDSKDIAFQIAGREAFKKAFLQCKPALLEPIVKMEVTVPQANMGDVIGDINAKRGRVVSSENLGNNAVVKVLVPLAEIQSFQAQLNSMTHGEGSYSVEFDHYDFVPPNLQKKIVEHANKG